MKKFKFSLETVLSYKQQVLDVLQGEHAAILAQVHQQEEFLTACWQQYRDCSAEYNRRSETGLLITDAMIYQSELRAMERQIQQETDRLEQLQAQAEEKRMEVVEAKKDTSSIEKLREKKLAAYDKAVAKSEEQLIEEFVSTARAMEAAGA